MFGGELAWITVGLCGLAPVLSLARPTGAPTPTNKRNHK